MTCDVVPLPLNSCSIIWDDPTTTLPRGRLQGHVRQHPTGGLTETCTTDGCTDCGKGLAVCIRGEDVCEDLESPPTCTNGDGEDQFVNPLRRDADGCLWVDARRMFAGLVPVTVTKSPVVTNAPASGGVTFGANTTADYLNTTCFSQKVKLEISINNALIGGPQPTGSGTVNTSGETVPCSEIFDCRTNAQIVYQLDVDGTTFDVFSSSGDYDVYSGTVCVGTFDVAAGETLSRSVGAALIYNADARSTFPASSGDILITFTPYPDLDA